MGSWVSHLKLMYIHGGFSVNLRVVGLLEFDGVFSKGVGVIHDFAVSRVPHIRMIP